MLQKKVCMVGVASTGKTSLVRRFVHSVFSDRYLSTIGVKIDRAEVAVGRRTVQLVLWDIAGRTESEDINASYLRGAAGIVYVADGTRAETIDALDDLKTLTDEAAGPVPTVLALNKKDLGDAWAFGRGELRALKRAGWNLFATSAKSGAGVERVFETLTAAILKEDA